MMEMILAFVLSWLCTLSGVALGGFLVFRTRRDSYEPLFPGKQPPGEAFNVEDDVLFTPKEESSKAEIPRPVQSNNDAFMQQFAETLAERDKGKNN